MYKVLRLSTTQHGSLHGPLCRSPWSLLWLSIVCSMVIQSSQWLSVVPSLAFCSTCCGFPQYLQQQVNMVPSAVVCNTFCGYLQYLLWISIVIGPFCRSPQSLPWLSVVPSVVLLHSYLLVKQDSDWLMRPHHSQSEHWH